MPPEYPWEMSRERLLEVLNETLVERDQLREALRSIQAVAVMTQNDHASQHRLDWLREIEARAREALGPGESDA